MNCQALQRWLLKADHPGRVPAEVRDHLADCAACRELQRRLLLIEQHVPLMPVPPSEARADFLHKFLAPPEPPLVVRPRVAAPPVRLWGYLAAAAAILLFLGTTAVVFYLIRPNPVEPGAAPVASHARPPLLDTLLERDLRLARATTQRERVEALADLAEDLHGETQLLAPEANPADLDALARLYADVVREGIVPRARDLAPTERQEVLARVARRLSETATAADRRSHQVPASARALEVIARAAREGDGELRKILQEKRS
jgi:hypothetical protein